MSSTSSRMSLFSVDPFTLSNNSVFSIDEYNHLCVQNGLRQRSNCDVMHSSNTLFSMGPLNLSGFQMSKRCANSDRVDTSSDEACVNQPLTFRRIPQQVSIKRFKFLSSDRQIAFDTNKSCYGNLCLSKFGKANIRGLQQKYFIT